MNSLVLTEALKLKIEERIKLVEDIWDSIAEVPEAIQLSNEQKSELDIRLENHYKYPELGINWKEIRKEFLNDK